MTNITNDNKLLIIGIQQIVALTDGPICPHQQRFQNAILNHHIAKHKHKPCTQCVAHYFIFAAHRHQLGKQWS